MTFAYASKLTAIEIFPAKQTTHIILNFTQPTLYRFFSLENKPRLVLDLQNTQLITQLKTISFSDPNIKLLRSGHPVPNTLRLVFDLDKMATHQIVVEKNKLIIEITRAPGARKISLPKKKKVIVKTPVTRDVVIVIDPGHGGKDPGALGPSAIEEKNIVLAISQQLANLINAQSNMRAVLTRHDDSFVTLRDRLKLAHKGNADLFISVHADSFFDNQSSGVSIYALSKSGATSEAARWIAKRENNSELGGADLSEVGQNYLLRSVLIDLSQTATITDSLRFGTTLLDSLNHVTRLHYSHVEQAPFVVLKSPDIPSVLIETGFISNPKEETRLRSRYHQSQLAEALFKGIQEYSKKYLGNEYVAH